MFEPFFIDYLRCLNNAGLSNLVQNKNYGDDFKFIFGEHEIQKKNLFAEFISPYVSQIHQSDPTINYVDLCNQNSIKQFQINSITKMSEVFGSNISDYIK